MKPRLSVVVPTLGLSPWLVPCLEALRREDEGLEILLVDQGEAPTSLPAELVDHHLRPTTNLGFAAANNLAFGAAQGTFIATVNDDLIIEAGWSGALLERLEATADIGAVQGLNRQLAAPERIDGCGIGWNRHWQAVQLGHGALAEEFDAAPREVFGVSATAALFRREALAVVGGEALAAFDPRLVSYYEDVDLACRLRHAGFRAWLEPAAQARHAGSLSGRQLPLARYPLLYGNRYLVLARLLGRTLWPQMPRIVGRDIVDLLQALGHGEERRARGIVAGWWRAGRHLHRFAHRRVPRVPLAQLQRFQTPPP